ncbi:MAG: peptidase caspase catalytic subunit p20 [Betaproteobacteria bacterium]|nr:peptidase caspase catalytic subunit p20 [Betaproteobacteria bacterium]
MLRPHEMRCPLTLSLRLKSVLLYSLGAFLLAVPLHAFNATDAGSAVNNLPRFALVIGNGKYGDVPLKNAANDARAIAEHLQRMGFDVTLKVDSTRGDMIETIRAFGRKLAAQKGVGLFYFAGHGAQLGWRNYLIPVDAAIRNPAEMQQQAVDLETLLESITRARNPMNVVILDACRDNPFGPNVKLEQKGLSQIDAPPGTLLAYSTAPGNAAADGGGPNGLYTGYVLQEMQAPAAKIEDVLKRVRLNVRRDSRGQQVPWESTSLEQDFYFIPPKALKKLSLEESEAQFVEELALWDTVKTAKERGPLEDYLRRFPSGKFSELAQFRLDRVLAQSGEQAVQAGDASRNAGNPFSKGTARVNLDYAIGDTYNYRQVDLSTSAETRKYTLTITEITDEQVVYNKGTQVRDLLGNGLKSNRGEFTGSEGAGAQFYVSDYSIGKKWTARYRVKGRDGIDSASEIDFKVVAKEKITVPAGEFDAFKVQGLGYSTRGYSLTYTYWVAPEQVRRIVAMEETFRGVKTNRVILSDRHELVSFRQLR